MATDVKADSQKKAGAVSTANTPASPAPASFNEIKGPKTQVGEMSENMDRILDIPITISVELGRTRMVINDLLQLGQGSVVELDKLAGEPMEILVNDRLIARGEVVVVNEKFGVRLTDIVSPVERIRQLKK
ncbi:MAG: flagellar motor switch protein FliN [Deltaproteobacteria bacterium]|nr:flagellar motor switch protein FliN [Deltaproteobacteria bacterium]